MEMKNYFILTFVLWFYFGTFAQTGKPENSKSTVLERIHWLIERSDTKTVRSGFQKICDENSLPSLVAELKDGIYKGATPYDDFGYRHEVVFEMKSGKMISIDYDEIHRDGHAKQHDEEYCKRMLKSGTTPAIAYPKYESEMLAKQNYNQIDAVSGATYSLFRFKLAILYAIMNSGQL
jgi:major membrane immunogen (membrane-anchored lipoprotein)